LPVSSEGKEQALTQTDKEVSIPVKETFFLSIQAHLIKRHIRSKIEQSVVI